MKNLVAKFIFLFLSCFYLNSCKTYTDPLFYSNYETRAIASENSNVFILRVQGKGVSKDEAQKNAIRNAVRDVIFSDIHVNYSNHKPLMRLITDPKEENKNELFFSDFFSKGGDFQNFATILKKNRDFYSDGSYYVVLADVRVNRGELKSYLINNGIIKYN